MFFRATASATSKALASIHNNGSVSYTKSVQIDFFCYPRLLYFPYDSQECSIKMGSWHYHSGTLNLTVSSDRLLYQYTFINDFILTNYGFVRIAHKYIAARYYVVMKRVPPAYCMKLVLPSLLAGFLVVGTFLVPNSSNERLTLCAALFLCLVILHAILHDIIPKNSVTILGYCLTFSLSVDFFAIILAITSFQLQRRGSLQQTMTTEMESNAEVVRIRTPESVSCCKSLFIQRNSYSITTLHCDYMVTGR